MSDGKKSWQRERRKRNIALALVLGGFAVLVYLMSLVQWHAGH